MKEKEVKELLNKHNLSWDDFSNWMYGQTLNLDEETMETIYFEDDVERYVELKVNNKPTYWD